MKIKEGQRFKCIKAVVMDNGYVDYVKGRVYVSEQDGCITDEEGFTTHRWEGEVTDASEHFLPVTDLKKYEVYVVLNNDEDIIKQLQALLEESGEKVYNHTLIGRHKGWPYAVIDKDGEWAPAGEVYVKGNNLTEVTVEELREILNKQKSNQPSDNSPQVAEGVTEDLSFQTIADAAVRLLEYKNKHYGNSALNPIEVFSGKTKVGQRADDKLSRIKNHPTLRKADVIDLLGYLILMCKENGWSDFSEFED